MIKDDWTTPSGKYREGFCSNYLRDVKPDSDNNHVVAKLYPSSITLPEDEVTPIFMAALGTGIAPMRSLY